MLESELKRRGTRLLQEAGWMVIHLIQTNMNGVPDTICLKDNRVVFIEWKQPGKKPNDLQHYRHMKIRGQGFEVIVPTSLSDIEHLR